MSRLLVSMSLVAALSACAQAPMHAKAEQPLDEGALVAASLGYHGPAVRPAARVVD